MAQDTPFALGTGVIAILTFPTVIIAAVAAFLGYTRRYRGAPEETNIFLSVYEACQEELDLLRDDYTRLHEASGPREQTPLTQAADNIHTAAEGALIRLKDEMERAGINLEDLKKPAKERRLAWIHSSGTLRERLQERIQLTGSLALIKMSILHARTDTLQTELGNAASKILNRLGNIAPDGLLGHIERSLKESEKRIEKQSQADTERLLFGSEKGIIGHLGSTGPKDLLGHIQRSLTESETRIREQSQANIERLLSESERRIVEQLESVAPDGLLGHIERLISESETRIREQSQANIERLLSESERRIVKHLESVAPDGLLGHIERLISESERRIPEQSENRLLQRLDELEARLTARVDDVPSPTTPQ